MSVFMKLVQTQFSTKIKVFQSDGGTEFVNQHVRGLLEENGTFHRLSCPYTPQQNGRVERKHRHVVETGLAMLFNGRVPPKYWAEAFSSAVYIINRLPTPVLDHKSPFEVLFSRTPSYGNFRAFACRVYPYLRDYASHKLAPRSLPCIFMGYSSQYKGYRCLDPCTSRTYITQHARFDENVFPFSNNSSTANEATLPLHVFVDDSWGNSCVTDVSDSPTSKPTTTTTTKCGLCTDDSDIRHTDVTQPEYIGDSHNPPSINGRPSQWTICTV
ncbi:retrovirus-related pol polyprotein from transposon TNT 1-94 [Tanacetum coccineum]